MIKDKTISVIMPAYNAEKTIERTYSEIPRDIVDHVILVDDSSSDKTKEVAHRLGILTYYHIKNKGYGGNQKSCYKIAADLNSDIVVMLHPDYQYSPKLIRAMVSLIADGAYKVVLGSRILGGGALRGGMPIYKYISNRFLTALQNILINEKLSEYHTGYRAFSMDLLKNIPLEENSDDFIFDNQLLVQIRQRNTHFAEITCPTKYFEEASSINFIRSSKYGIQCILTSIEYLFHKIGFIKSRLFKNDVTWYKSDKHHYEKYNPSNI